jgi:hypothetical protein
MKRMPVVPLTCNIVLLVISLFYGCASVKQEAPAVDVDQFIGKWVNIDANTRGITRVEIRAEANKTFVHMWGACTPKECDWGEMQAGPAANGLKVKWVLSWAVEQQELAILPDGKLKVDGQVHYTDNSGRKDRNYTEMFGKK